MKNITQIISTILISAISTFANANEHSYGVKGGIMLNSSGNASNANSVGFVTKIPLTNNSSSVEVELTTSIIGGGVGGGNDYDWDLTTIAGYYSHRINQDNYYMKLKAGLLYERVVITDNSPFPLDDVTENDTGLSLGFGIGWTINKNKIEVEYTIIEQDISFLSVGYFF